MSCADLDCTRDSKVVGHTNGTSSSLSCPPLKEIRDSFAEVDKVATTVSFSRRERRKDGSSGMSALLLRCGKLSKFTFGLMVRPRLDMRTDVVTLQAAGCVGRATILEYTAFLKKMCLRMNNYGKTDEIERALNKPSRFARGCRSECNCILAITALAPGLKLR